jgi:DNA mismatch repair protein MutL
MGQIQVLPDNVINQIAAGEVVERPASVVKELLENALDAGARQITVSVQNGGKDLISVLDDGAGMSEADARLSCQRHATSKIREARDLEAITTLGFRGEALASIAAVSRFELVTCDDESAGGTRLVLEGGREKESGRQGFPRGTRVTVRELFHNQPARRKFLRSNATEFGHIQQALLHVALAHPALRLRLVHNERVIQDLPAAATLAERTHAVFGRELEEGMLAVSGQEGPLAFEGLVALPSHAKTSRRWQYLFVNGRPVRHAGLNHAIYHAYRTLLMKERHPSYVLQLRLDPREVDVNVHPAKTEVRLRNGQWAHTVLADKLYRAVLEGSRNAAFGREAAGAAFGRETGGAALGRTGTHGARALGAPESAGGQLSLAGSLAAASLAAASLGAASLAGGADQVRDTGPRLSVVSRQPSQTAVPDAAPHTPGHPESVAIPHDALDAHPLSGEGLHFQPLAGRSPGATAQEMTAWEITAALGRNWRVLGQLARTYLLVQRGTGLIVIDQHAAHERILFERYRAQFSRGKPVTEAFLVPETLELSPQNGLLLEQYLPEWRRLGFEIEGFGRGGYLLRQVPALLKGKDLKALLLEVLDELALFGKSGRIEEVFNEIMERVACHAAVRAGDELAPEEMDALLAELVGMDINLYCPHGRPVWVEVTERELERRFKRVV